MRTLRVSIRPMAQVDTSRSARPKDRASDSAASACSACSFGVLTYGFNLFNLDLSIDDELAGFLENAVTAWLVQGRWATYLLNKYFLPNPIIPVVPMAITIAGLAASYVMSAITWRWPIDLAHYVAAPCHCLSRARHLSAFTQPVLHGCNWLCSVGLHGLSRGHRSADVLFMAIPILATAIARYRARHSLSRRLIHCFCRSRLARCRDRSNSAPADHFRLGRGRVPHPLLCRLVSLAL